MKAPDATKVRLNFWSGPKVDMVKQPDGVWSIVTEPLTPGLHYYMLIVDGVEMADTGSRAFFGGGTETFGVVGGGGGLVPCRCLSGSPHCCGACGLARRK